MDTGHHGSRRLDPTAQHNRAETVRLTGAACIGRHQLFDQTAATAATSTGARNRSSERKPRDSAPNCPVIRHCPSATVTTELKEPA